MKKIIVIAIVVLSIVTGAFIVKRNSYVVVHPERGNITEAVYGLGKVKARKRFEVIIGVITTVKKLSVNEGDLVAQGDPLIKFESGTEIRAPFPGTVTFLRLKEGETALPQVPLLRLEDLRDRYVELSLEQEAALRVSSGLPSKVSFENLRGQVYPGKVTAIFPRQDEFLALVEVPGLSENVLPGMTADVTIEIGTIKDALLIPLKAVSSGSVTVRRDGKWRKLKLQIGHVDGARVEVLGDELSEKDELRMREGE